jgi:hypothetical protein
MANAEIPDFVPEYLINPKSNFVDGFFEKIYRDGVTAVYDLGNDGAIYDIETRFPDRSLHYEQDQNGLPLFIKNGIPPDAEI